MAEATATPSEGEIEVGQLFSNDRVRGSALRVFLLCLYFPFGVLLCVFRVLYGLHVFVVSCVLRKSSRARCVVLRVMCGLLGVVVRESGRRDAKARMIVANHVSALDHLAVDLIQPCMLPCVWDLPQLLIWCFGYADLGARQGRRVLIDRARLFCQESALPLLAFPEGAITSGRTGLLKFDSWPFDASTSVQPAVVTIERPYPTPIAASVLGSRWWTDLLWFFFVPYSVFRVRWLERVSAADGEELARRVEALVAAECGVRVTAFTSRDAIDYAKRRLLEQRRPVDKRPQRAAKGRPAAGELDTMAFAVKEMFPDVSLLAIRRDIELTKSVDATVSNVVAKQLPAVDEHATATVVSSDPSSWWSVFEFRKWNMIEEHRRLYLQRRRE